MGLSENGKRSKFCFLVPIEIDKGIVTLDIPRDLMRVYSSYPESTRNFQNAVPQNRKKDQEPIVRGCLVNLNGQRSDNEQVTSICACEKSGSISSIEQHSPIMKRDCMLQCGRHSTQFGSRESVETANI